MQTLTRAGLDGLAQVIEVAPPATAATYICRLSEIVDPVGGLDQIPGLLHAIELAESAVIERRMELRRHLSRCVEQAVSECGVAAVRRAIGPTK